MLLVLIAACIAGSAFFVLDALLVPARERRAALRRVGAVAVAGGGDSHAASLRERVVDPAGARLAAAVLRLNPRTSTEAVRFRLVAAGLPHVPATTFLAAKGAAAIAGIFAGVVVGGAAGGRIALVFALAGCAGGYLLPDACVSRRTRERRDAVQAALPDALDLLAVSVEAGLSFDAALVKLTERLDGPVAEEFTLVAGALRVGRTRREAFEDMARRVDVPEMAAFSRSLIQADRLGLSLARVLKVQAEDSRNRRQAAAEEKAMKAPVKMLFPTVIFIFPALFVVVLGPALMNFMKAF